MHKNWIKRIGIFAVIVIIIFAVINSSVKISFVSDNFPLSEKWSSRLGENIQQITVLDNKILLVRTQAVLYSVDIESGKVLWKYWTDWPLIIEESAMETNGKAFLTDGSELVALNLSNGQQVWRQRYLSSANAEVVDVSSDFVAVSDRSELLLYKTVDGTLQWKKWACRGIFQAYFYDARIVVPCDGFTAFDIHTGEIVWETQTDHRIWASAFADGVIFSAPSLEYISAFDLKTRKNLWITPWPNDRAREIRVDGELLFVNDYHQFCILERKSGRIHWCIKGKIYSQNPTRIGDVVYIYDAWQSQVTAIDIKSGSPLGKLTRPALKWPAIDAHRDQMVYSNGLLIFGSVKQLFAFGR
jgi:outer membrane protein assembly factor BamB